jgi:hypothetical protein
VRVTGPLPLRARAPHAGQPAFHARVEVPVEPGREVDGGRDLEVAGQLRVELLDGERGVGAVVAQRALDAGAAAVPGFLLEVARPDEQDEAVVGVRRRQDGDRIGLEETGQVGEVRVLAKRELGVVRAGLRGIGTQHHRPGPHAAQDLGAALGERGLRDAVPRRGGPGVIVRLLDHVRGLP